MKREMRFDDRPAGRRCDRLAFRDFIDVRIGLSLAGERAEKIAHGA